MTCPLSTEEGSMWPHSWGRRHVLSVLEGMYSIEPLSVALQWQWLLLMFTILILNKIWKSDTRSHLQQLYAWVNQQSSSRPQRPRRLGSMGNKPLHEWFFFIHSIKSVSPFGREFIMLLGQDIFVRWYDYCRNLELLPTDVETKRDSPVDRRPFPMKLHQQEKFIISAKLP